jgi:NDP-sugar pyrophosphorylase family protein
MVYAIIAAGEGSRLSNEGYVGLKPMVSLNGKMMIDRLIGVFVDNGAHAIVIIINESSDELEKHLCQLEVPVPIHILKQNTESSLHSFGLISDHMQDVEELCLTTTDTVFDSREFKNYIDNFNGNPDIDGLLAVTSFIDDESPLYVSFNTDLKIESITDEAVKDDAFVSGGIYCLRKKALDMVSVALSSGLTRMRNFQRLMLENGAVLNAYPFDKIMDIDHVADIDKAEYFLSEVEL